MKTCFKCGKPKLLGEFYQHSMMADGYLNKCKDCTKADSIRTRRARAEYYNEYDRQRGRTEARKAINRERSKKTTKDKPGVKAAYIAEYRRENPEKYRARNAMSNAIRDGRLIRMPCEVCGDPKSQGHHHDYSKPLDVRWLCRNHHGEEHRLYP